MTRRLQDFPIGASITVDELTHDPYQAIARLRASEPVSWLPALDGWMVTRRDLAVQAMRDAASFTVDDERFTTAAVLGQSMLSLDGTEQDRHRSPFAPVFRPQVIREHFEDFVHDEARRLVQALQPSGVAELRTSLAGPLAVTAIMKFLGIHTVGAQQVLDWHASISQAIVNLTVGVPIRDRDVRSIDQLTSCIGAALDDPTMTSLLRQAQGLADLDSSEMVSDASVIMFGAIETAEGMTANALFHLLSSSELVKRLQDDRSLVPKLIEESLRLEPAAAVIDRYSTAPTELGGVAIPQGELVVISLLGANRDPAVFQDPDRLDLERVGSPGHVSFVQGPHGCLGLHLARLETSAAVHAVLDHLSDIHLDHNDSVAPQGLVFRKADSVKARWTPPASS